jgi:LuxR family maltose regulon positive regulatory protein
VEVSQDALVDPLTDRELDVLRLLAEGLSNRDIADQLVLSVGTVKVHTRNIYSKLGVGSRTQAIVRGRELGLLA